MKKSRWTPTHKLNEKWLNSLTSVSPVQSSGAVWKSRWTSRAPVPNKPAVSVDVKQLWTESRRTVAWISAQNDYTTSAKETLLYTLVYKELSSPLFLRLTPGTLTVSILMSWETENSSCSSPVFIWLLLLLFLLLFLLLLLLVLLLFPFLLLLLLYQF